MNRATRNGVIAAVAASGAMAVALPVSSAFAADGALADGSATGSPGVISGNTIQLPVHVPVNVCGNTVNVAGLLNPAAGNTCANTGSAASDKAGHHRAAGAHGATTRNGGPAGHGGATAEGVTEGSPGVLSGNGVQLPVHLPVNVSGNSVNVVGIGNPADGNVSVNTSQPPTRETPAPVKAHPAPRALHPVESGPMLAHTGADATAPALAGGAAFFLTGVALYRRFRPSRNG
ncbi:chaplin [Streptomyces sp. NPDC047028]|uniref:chaplin n=1 Tax=Streptomyces sp. NPDC047028 TaxID=3155793 RepID=UPI0033D489A5